jgi:hypothetical protein
MNGNAYGLTHEPRPLAVDDGSTDRADLMEADPLRAQHVNIDGTPMCRLTCDIQRELPTAMTDWHFEDSWGGGMSSSSMFD